MSPAAAGAAAAIAAGGNAAHSPPTTGAEAVVQAAAQAGIDVCFANPGTTEMWFVSALDKYTGIKSILGLQENVVTGAADGYARMARRPAMTLLHLGPGLANGLANLHNARRARSPVLNIIGDMASWHRAADPILNMDIEGLAASVSSVVINASHASLREDVQRLLQATSITGLVTGSATLEPAEGSHACNMMGSSRPHAGSTTTATAIVGKAVDATAAGGGSSRGNHSSSSSGSSSIRHGPSTSRVATLVMPHDLSWESPKDCGAALALSSPGEIQGYRP